MDINKTLRATPVVPLIQADDPAVAIEIARALIEGGLTVLEIVLRTPAALDCLAAIASSVDGATAGAGTVLNAEQATAAVKVGARFIVSPGLDGGVVDVALGNDMPVYPGVATATEMQAAWNMGLRVVKFFPAGQAGGTAMIRSLTSVFRDMSIMPTGGVSAENLADYLAVPAVIACGGSWLTPKSAIDAGDYAAITELARAAVTIAREARR